MLAAEEAAGTQVLRMLADGPDEIIGVLTSLSMDSGLAGVGGLAKRFGIPVFPAECATQPEFAETCADVDLFLNVHSLFKIHPALLDLPIIGTFNLHPGPLPTFGGLNAPSWAVYLGEENYAVTLHWVEEEIDAGPIAYTSEFPIGPKDTGLSVSARCVKVGVPLIRRLVDTARTNPERIPRIPQSREGRRVFLRSTIPGRGRINWSEPAVQVSRLIRACDYYPMDSPWATAWTLLGDSRIQIQKARLEAESSGSAPGTIFRTDDSGAWVATSNGSIVVERLLIDGGLATCAGQFDRGGRFS